MKIDIILILLLLSFMVWIVLHLTDRRRVINGLVFLVSIASFLGLLLYIDLEYNIRLLSSVVGFIILAMILIMPIVYIVSTVLFFTTAIELIKKEGLTLSHSLSLIFALGVVFSTILFPFVQDYIKSKLVLFILAFFTSSFIYFSLGFIVYFIASIVYYLYPVKKDKDYLVVLGSGLNKEKVTALLASRIDKALEFYRKQVEITNKAPKIIMSGGQGKDEIVAEAEAMKNYALEKGIKLEDIICENRSKNTKENISYSKEIIFKDKGEASKVLFFTSNFHVFRASLLAKKENLDWNGLGSRTKLYYYISATIREYIAVLFIHKKLNLILGLAYSLISAILLIFSKQGL